MTILAGTCSWTDKTLIESGNFYPEAVKTPEARLEFYASKFPIVEVDSSYYAIPGEKTAKQWADRTPESRDVGEEGPGGRVGSLRLLV